jgi:tetratricopeptide (TPR) repeat protein
LDSLRFRTDSRLNAVTRETAGIGANPRVTLLDAESAFARESPHGIPGEEWFYEHVHFTFAGNYFLARLFADQLTDVLPPGVRSAPGPGPWLSETECARRLGYTDNQRYEIGIAIRRRFGESIYRAQSGYAERFEALETQLSALRQQTKPTARRQALQICREASANAPRDWVLHDLMARLHVALEEPEGAAKEWERVTELIPHWAIPYAELGHLAVVRRGKSDGTDEAALAWFNKALQVNPDCSKAHVGIGNVLAGRGEFEAARRHFRRALEVDPGSPEAAEGLARQP